jgi:hypothetical protein
MVVDGLGCLFGGGKIWEGGTGCLFGGRRIWKGLLREDLEGMFDRRMEMNVNMNMFTGDLEEVDAWWGEWVDVDTSRAMKECIVNCTV